MNTGASHLYVHAVYLKGTKKLIDYTCAGARDVAEKEHYVQGHGHELAAYYSQLYSI